jgi:hypothetical protein
MEDKPTDFWLEPCCGKGAFLEALFNMEVPASRIMAIDLDDKRCASDRLARTKRDTEFLGWSLSCTRRFSKIVGNPPFVSFRRLPERLQSVAEQLDCHWAGSSNGNSNLWFAFLRASLSLLKKGGSLGFIVPAAFDYADYAAALRSAMPKHFAEFEVHRCFKPLFDGVQDGCVVLIGRGYEMSNRSQIRYEYASAADLIRELGRRGSTKPIVAIRSRFDWTQPSVRLGKVMKVTIGCVTGDSQYFLLRESQRVRLQLPVSALRPVLTRARHLRTASVTEGYWKKLKTADERIWLFRPAKRHMKVASVRRYLHRRFAQGGCNRRNFKVKQRKVWYRADMPTTVDGFVSGNSGLGPWIALNYYPTLSATNTLYCVKFGEDMSRDEQAAWALSLLTKQFREQYAGKTRTYPDGLLKIEPGDLARLRVVRPPQDCKGAHKKYKEVVSLLLQDGRLAAERLAKKWFESKRATNHRRRA